MSPDSSEKKSSEQSRENKGIRELLKDILANPKDKDTLQVIGDWCEQHGFDESATELREGRNTSRTLNGLRLLFGDRPATFAVEEGENLRYLPPRYSAVLPMPTCSLEPFATGRIVGQPKVLMKINKFMLPSHVLSSVSVEDMRVGQVSIAVSGSGSMPGELFGLFAPELCDEKIQFGQSFTVILTNISDRRLSFNSCALGRSAPETFPLPSLGPFPQEATRWADMPMYPFAAGPIQPLDEGVRESVMRHTDELRGLRERLAELEKKQAYDIKKCHEELEKKVRLRK